MAASSGPAMPRALLIVLILARDLLQTALLSAGVFALAAVFSSRVASQLHRWAAALLALVILANHVAFMQLGTFASREVLATAWGWVKLHPQALFSYCTLSAAFVVLASITGIALPAILPRVARVAAINRSLPKLLLTLLPIGAVSVPLAAARFGERAFPVHGYWAEVANAALRGDATTPLALKVPSQCALLLQYQKLAFYPSQPEAATHLLWTDIEARRRPRHMIVVGLETAARAFYPLTSSPDLPTFARMTEHAIVSEHHYTSSPYTRIGTMLGHGPWPAAKGSESLDSAARLHQIARVSTGCSRACSGASSSRAWQKT